MSLRPFSPFRHGALSFGDAYRASVMADSPVAYWRLGESSGTTAEDEMETYDGTYVGSPTLGASGPISGKLAVEFDGTNTKNVSLPLSVATGFHGSIGAWFNLDSATPAQAIVSASDVSVSIYELRLAVVSGKVSMVKRNSTGQTVFDCGSISSGVWHYVGLVSDGTSYACYLNGVSQSLNFTSGTNNGDWFSDISGLDNLQIALLTRATNLIPADGKIAEVAIYGTALSSDRWAAHYAAAGY